eukprot:1158504-Pelagomonas_calceolata.AAC.3
MHACTLTHAAYCAVLEPLVPRMEGATHDTPPKGKEDLEHSGEETCFSSGGDSDPHNAQMSAGGSA